MKNIIEIRNLSKQYRIRTNRNLLSGIFKPNWEHKNAVSSISFGIKPGESVAFLGPNGAGKTTTTKMLTGLIRPSSGVATVLGYEPFGRNHNFLKQIGLVMGNKSGLNWDLTASQSFELLQQIYDIPVNTHKQRVAELTELLTVDKAMHKQVRKLSLGERMKLELVAAILHDPKVLFLDEPTIGLDIESKQKIRKFLRQVHAQGKTILLTSHDMDDVDEVCDRVIIINNGVVMHDGSMVSLNQQYSSEKFVLLEFGGSPPSTDDISKIGKIVSRNNATITIAVPKNKLMERISLIGKNYDIRDITIESVPLEVIVSDLFNK